MAHRARFEICPKCGQHGRILTRTKRESDEFATQSFGRALIVFILRNFPGALTYEDAARIRDQIILSNLPEVVTPSVPDTLIYALYVYNNAEANHSKVHEYIESIGEKQLPPHWHSLLR